jgi:hypothetical protein
MDSELSSAEKESEERASGRMARELDGLILILFKES